MEHEISRQMSFVEAALEMFLCISLFGAAKAAEYHAVRKVVGLVTPYVVSLMPVALLVWMLYSLSGMR